MAVPLPAANISGEGTELDLEQIEHFRRKDLVRVVLHMFADFVKFPKTLFSKSVSSYSEP